MFNGLTKCELHRLQYDFVDNHNSKQSVNKSSKQTSKDWLAFFPENPKISQRKPKVQPLRESVPLITMQ
jgi:hypothetical protein